MSRRTKIIIAVVAVLLLLLLAWLLFLRPTTSSLPPEQVNVNGAMVNRSGLGVNYSAGSFNTNVAEPPAPAPVPPPPVADERNNLRATAKSFAELYGSFSTEGNYQNLVDAEFYMTADLKAQTQADVDARRANPPATTFSGTTTRALSVDITSYDKASGSASVTVKTQRRETGSTTGAGTVYYQDLKLEFVKVGDAWKVKTATWVPR